MNFNALSSNFTSFSSENMTIKSAVTTQKEILTKPDESDDTGSVLGYKVDKDGYFTNEFNKAAGIPDDYKIHSDTIKSFVAVRANKDLSYIAFREIDIAKTVGNAYKLLTQLVDENTLNSKESFTTDEISKFPQGYEYDKKTLKITKKYGTVADYMSATFENGKRDKNKTIATTFYNRSTIDYYTNGNKLKPSTDIFDSENGGKEKFSAYGLNFNTTRERYTNDDGSVTKGGLLVGILNSNFHATEGKPTYLGFLHSSDKNISGDEYSKQIQLWLLNHDPDRVSDEEFNALSEPMKEFIKFHRTFDSINLRAKNTSKKEEADTQKDPLQILFEQMDKDFKEMLKKLQERAQKARLEQRKAMQQNLDTQTIKNVAQTSKDTLNEMLEFLSKMSKQHGVNLDINEVKTAFINLTDGYKFSNKTIDIKA
ncbi:Cj0814 family flagellar-dependent secreted protein [uncultured Campylobacter sp.]|uniref:Cj0814 family flagellar-dependent secreted protein n=1 Tax=uncultured Campylobacter sp. TaxID=218934 RepID=UPI002633AB57|nr:hypothetical protein [uncultured Campylobacter sp.]